MTKRILISLAIIGAVSAIVVGATTAYFSDTETSTGNTFSAGTLDLQVNDQNPWTSVAFNVSDVKPGDSGSTTIHLKNVGTLPKPGGPPWTSKVFITFENLQDNDVSCSEPEREVEGGNCGTDPGAGELAENLNITVKDFWDPNCQSNKRFEETHTLAEWVSQGETFLNDDMPAGDVNCVVIDWSVDSSVGNVIQSDSATFDIKFTLEQTEPWQ